jgi:hypothetical protein
MATILLYEPEIDPVCADIESGWFFQGEFLSGSNDRKRNIALGLGTSRTPKK